MMNKLLIGLLGAAVIATGGYAAATGIDDHPARTVSLPGATDGTTGATGATTTDDAGDISGPCDEAEHRNDPRCTGVTVPARAPATTTAGTTTAGDISGPCDKAEHRNDPRCTGVVTDRNDDNSGPGSGDDDGDDDNSGPGSGDDDHDEDRSGSNSGRG